MGMKGIWILVVIASFVAGSITTGTIVFADDDDDNDLSSLLCPVGQAMTGILFEDDDEILDVICDTVGVNQQCPPGEFVVGIDSIGEIICDPLPSLTCPNDCSNNGVCIADNLCQCNAGFSGDDCSVSVCNAVNCEQCVSGDPNTCQACLSGFLMDVTGQCTIPTDADSDGFTGADGDCDDNNGTIFPGAPEVCDGVDNDCDNQIDEGGDACATGLQGVCAAGTTLCEGGSVNCMQNVLSSPEVCDGADNDCDGNVDDIPSSDPNTHCEGGTVVCDPGFADCFGFISGCEILINFDVNHCGGCFIACSAGELCSNGVCLESPGPGSQ